MYVVKIGFGEGCDFVEGIEFITKDEEKAVDWVNRYNRIIQDNKQRMIDFENKAEDNDVFPLWYDLILYTEPIARVEEVDYRPYWK